MPARVATAVVAPIPMTGGRRSMSAHGSDQPVKKQSKWSPDEDALIIELRGGGMKWEDISKRLPGRSAISCRLHYQNYLERRSEWDDERKNKLARLYERFKSEMWAKVAEELAVPWRAAEAMHWQLGETEMARRAGVVPFSLAAVNLEGGRRTSPSRGHAHSQSHGNVASISSPRLIYGRPQPNPNLPPGGRVINPRRETMSHPPPQPLPLPPPPQPHTVGPEPVDTYYGSGPGLAPIQSQPPPRGPGLLPSVAELTTGMGLYSTTAGPPVPVIATTTQAAFYPNIPGYPNIEPARAKRRASSEAEQQDASHRRRMG